VSVWVFIAASEARDDRLVIRSFHYSRMGSTERRRDRGRRAADRVIRLLGDEIRSPRVEAGLSQEQVAIAAGVSKAEVSRVERGIAAWLTIDELCRLAAPLGLDVSIKLYPGGPRLRDGVQVVLLERLHREVSRELRWLVEVGLPLAGDRRAWDAVISGEGWRVAVEAESRLHDLQALERRIALKRRDDGDVVVLLLVNDTRINREALAAGATSLRAAFPLDARAMLSALRAGKYPGASGIVLL
jgi:transcriptional regulator with XRE-family HTH domain